MFVSKRLTKMTDEMLDELWIIFAINKASHNTYPEFMHHSGAVISDKLCTMLGSAYDGEMLFNELYRLYCEGHQQMDTKQLWAWMKKNKVLDHPKWTFGTGDFMEVNHDISEEYWFPMIEGFIKSHTYDSPGQPTDPVIRMISKDVIVPVEKVSLTECNGRCTVTFADS